MSHLVEPEASETVHHKIEVDENELITVRNLENRMFRRRMWLCENLPLG